jgi:hypothetical protein
VRSYSLTTDVVVKFMKHKLYFRAEEGERKGQKVVSYYSKEKVCA